MSEMQMKHVRSPFDDVKTKNVFSSFGDIH